MNSRLQRERAPFSAAVWSEIDAAAIDALKVQLGARKVVDFDGPRGWKFSAVDLGRVQPLAGAGADGVEGRLRQTQPLVELKAAFTLDRAELDAIERGAKDGDLDPVTAAAIQLATAEDRAIFHGLEDAGIEGICVAAAASRLSLNADFEHYPATVAEAVACLRDAGVGGPYGIVLGPRCYRGLTKTTSNGFPVMNHVRRLLDGPIAYSAGLDGAVVLSLRGGDFELTVGEDISIGYEDHDADSVRLYLQESLTFRVLAPEAAAPLGYDD